MSSRNPIFAGLVCALLSACAMAGEDPAGPEAPAASEAATEADAIVRIRYRYDKAELVATFRQTREGQELVPGPDDEAISELMNRPNTGVAEDPAERGLFHVYTNAEELAAVQEALRDAPRKVVVDDEATAAEAPAAPGVRAQSLCVPPGCNGTCPVYPRYAYVYKAVNYLGGGLSTGSMPTLADYGFNDQISSAQLQNGQVTLYEHPSFGGHSITLAPDIEVHTSDGCSRSYGSIPDLRNYTMISRWYWTNVSWNDQASSAYFYAY